MRCRLPVSDIVSDGRTLGVDPDTVRGVLDGDAAFVPSIDVGPGVYRVTSEGASRPVLLVAWAGPWLEVLAFACPHACHHPEKGPQHPMAQYTTVCPICRGSGWLARGTDEAATFAVVGRAAGYYCGVPLGEPGDIDPHRLGAMLASAIKSNERQS